jgi:hypothetical protein
MLDLEQITEVAREVAETRLGKGLEEVRVKPMCDWTGRDGFDVLMIVDPSVVPILTGTDAAYWTLGEIGERLSQLGEPRFAYVGYVTREELEAPHDPDA